MSAYTKIYIRPGENELIETDIKVRPDARSALRGVVRNGAGKPVADALVILSENKVEEELYPTAQAFTDETGQFLFGPLTAGQLYILQVFHNAVKLRELEIVIEE